MTRRHSLAALAAVPLLLTALAFCAEKGPAAPHESVVPAEAAGDIPAEAYPVEPAAALDRIERGAVVIDVRTPEEYTAGHLGDALNIDWNAGSFATLVADLPRDGTHVLYCRSGSRATRATAVMLELGFTDVVNGGAYDDLR